MNTITPDLVVRPVRRSPIQDSVTIVQNMALAGMQGDSYMKAVAELHQHMSAFAMSHVRAQGYEQHMQEVDPDYVLTAEECTDEANENTPLARTYWEGTSLFFRKVFQAAAAAA